MMSVNMAFWTARVTSLVDEKEISEGRHQTTHENTRDVFEWETTYRRHWRWHINLNSLLLLVISICVVELDFQLEGVCLVLFRQLGHNIYG